MDPLSVLRDFTKDKQLDQVEIDGDRVKFGDKYSLPKTILTSYKKSEKPTDLNAPPTTYDLETLVYFIKEHQNSHWLTYVKAAREKGLSQVVFTDKKNLTEYLNGITERSDKVLQTAPEFTLPAITPTGDLEPSAKRAKLTPSSAPGTNLSATTDLAPLISKERSLRDRNSQLSLPGKSFKAIFDILGMIKRDEEQAKLKAQHQEMKSNQQRSSQKSHQKVVPPPPPPLSEGAPPPPPSSAPPPATVRAAEKEKAKAQSARSHSQHHHGSGKKPQQKPSSRHTRPIIIVPAAASSKITMLNVKDFLEHGVYKSNEVLRKEGQAKVPTMTVLRKMGRKVPVPYEITEKPPPLKHEDWKRVVAVFVTGAAWQFKEWPRGADPGQMANTFHDVLGIHVSLKNEPVSDTIKSWNIKRFVLHPNDRHGDQPVVMEIFKSLDTFLSGRKRGAELNF